MTQLPCQQEPNLFTAPDEERHNSPAYTARVAAARRLCLTCPIRLACRDRGREQNQPGIWGGETDDERAAAGYPTPETRRHQALKTYKTRRKQVAA